MSEDEAMSSARLVTRCMLLPLQAILICLCLVWGHRWRHSQNRRWLLAVFLCVAVSALLRLVYHVLGLVASSTPLSVHQAVVVSFVVFPQLFQLSAYACLVVLWSLLWGFVSEDSTTTVRKTLTVFMVFDFTAMCTFAFSDAISHSSMVIVGGGLFRLGPIEVVMVALSGLYYFPLSIAFLACGCGVQPCLWAPLNHEHRRRATWRRSATAEPSLAYRIVSLYFYLTSVALFALFVCMMCAASVRGFITSALFEFLAFSVFEAAPLFAILKGRWRASLYNAL
eukprot:m51a1_g2667 hypothetical protein (282) ;mRNA; f:707100-708408